MGIFSHLLLWSVKNDKKQYCILLIFLLILVMLDSLFLMQCMDLRALFMVI